MAPSAPRIAPEGLPFLAAGAGLALLTLPFSRRVAGGLAALTAAVGAFFRDPEREVPAGPRLVVAPADGKVVRVVEGADGGQVLSIFLSILDVHVNRAPIAGKITEVSYKPGGFRPAYDDAASEANEQNRSVIEGDEGRVALTQIAGFVARRIVFRKRVGDRVARGERVGLIRFGSRTDIGLPTGTALRVAVGDRVKGGSSILAELPA